MTTFAKQNAMVYEKVVAKKHGNYSRIFGGKLLCTDISVFGSAMIASCPDYLYLIKLFDKAIILLLKSSFCDSLYDLALILPFFSCKVAGKLLLSIETC